MLLTIAAIGVGVGLLTLGISWGVANGLTQVLARVDVGSSRPAQIHARAEVHTPTPEEVAAVRVQIKAMLADQAPTVWSRLGEWMGRRNVQRVLAVAMSSIVAAPALAAPVTVSDAWFRALPGNLPAGGYFTAHNGGKTNLAITGASSSACGMLMLGLRRLRR